MRPKQQQPIPDVEKEESNIPLLPEYTPTSSLPVAAGVKTINDDNPIILFHFGPNYRKAMHCIQEVFQGKCKQDYDGERLLATNNTISLTISPTLITIEIKAKNSSTISFYGKIADVAIEDIVNFCTKNTP